MKFWLMDLLPLNSPSVDDAFVSTLFFLDGVKRVVGGTVLAMACTGLMMEHVHYGGWKLRP
jgi:hypothetical protein